MDLEELKTNHPKVYEAVMQIGVQRVREVAMAHLRLAGSATGGLKLAVSAIEAGAAMSPSAMASYVEATRWAQEIAARQADCDAAAEVLACVTPPSEFGLEAATLRELRRLVSDDELDDTRIEDLEDA